MTSFPRLFSWKRALLATQEGHYCNWTKWRPRPRSTSLGLGKRIADHKQEMISCMVSECCLASLSFSLLSLRHRGAAESQTSIGRRCHVAEWLTELNEGVWRNKRLFVWCLVVLSSDSYIKAALVCGDLRLSYLFLSSYFSWGFLIWSLYRSDSSLHEIHPSGSLWNQATISTSFVCEKQKIRFLILTSKKTRGLLRAELCLWLVASKPPTCLPIARPPRHLLQSS